MTRKDFKFQAWCRIATNLIRYGPDRKTVAKELMDHLEDAYDAYIEKGMTPEDAEQRALEQMGSAEEIAPQLAAIHKPFWGYVLRACKIAMVILLVLSLKPLWDYATDLNLYDKPNSYPTFEAYEEASYGGDTGRKLLHLSQPEVSFTSDANTFTVTDVAVFTETLKDGTQSAPRLLFLIQQKSPLPWSEQEGYFQSFKITDWFFLRDDLGNVYKGYMKSELGEGCYYTNGVQSGIFTYTHQCCIFTFPAEAKWVELCYEQDGRSIGMIIPLTGGNGT